MKKTNGIIIALFVCASCLLMAAETPKSVPESTMPSASVLRPGDVLAVTVFRVAEFSKTVRVEEDGTFRYPFCGNVQAAGKKASDVAKELEQLLAKQISEPQVDVYVESWSTRPVYILGEVNKSMSLELPNYGHMTALQAISTAGGFTEMADLTHVAVLRRDVKNHGQLVRIPVDVTALASQTSGGDDFILQPEDTLIIPKAPPVYVAGMLSTPGIYNIDTQRPPLCSEIIIRAGGMKDGADERAVQIIRTKTDGTLEHLVASVHRKPDGMCEKDVRLQPGDYVFVASAADIFVLGEVGRPGPLTLRPEKNVTIGQAIIMAGGFLATAKRGDVLLIRDGRKMNLDLKKIYEDVEEMKNDIPLQAGDIVFVRESFW